MVKIGIICEGMTEFILMQSPAFRTFLTDNNIALVNTINAEGSGNLLPHNIAGYIQTLEKAGAERILILTDLDQDVCITKTKTRISARPQDIVIIAVKQIEAWFLACTTAMQALLRDPNFLFTFPEKETTPFKTINSLLVDKTGKGIGMHKSAKIRLINRLLSCGLDLSEAAIHLECPSARYFMEKMKNIGNTAI
jgi:predicted ribonuclease YlaK